jgi:hypothetical protein
MFACQRVLDTTPRGPSTMTRPVKIHHHVANNSPACVASTNTTLSTPSNASKTASWASAVPRIAQFTYRPWLRPQMEVNPLPPSWMAGTDLLLLHPVQRAVPRGVIVPTWTQSTLTPIHSHGLRSLKRINHQPINPANPHISHGPTKTRDLRPCSHSTQLNL